MRVLLVLRGAPESGKSTWAEKNKLNPYTISSDKIRLMYAAPRMNADGSTYISQRNNKIVWKTFMDMLEYRMSNGDFTVLDATHCSESDFNKYYELVKKYRYKVYCIDFTDISAEDCKRNNALREEYKRVPKEVIDRYFEKLQNSSIPSWVTVLKPNEYNHMWRCFTDVDMTEYEKIIFVGDIHGCYDALMKALDGGIKENIFYVFTGDLLDRGPQNAEVLRFALENYTKKNVCFLEGNHEMHLWNWAKGYPIKSPEFIQNTKPQLEAANIKKDIVADFCWKLKEFLCINACAPGIFLQVFVSHGGLSNFQNPSLISADTFIHGAGVYKDSKEMAETFAKHYPCDIQVHGHRNIDECDFLESKNCINLEGGVERGGYLRAAVMDNSFRFNYIESKQDNIKEIKKDEITEYLKELRSSQYIKEKQFDNISSFNFTRQAFWDGIWDNITTKARGLFINTKTNKIVARSYDKFFAIDERPETQIGTLSKNLKYPLDVYIKENGFLGILGYDSESDELIFASKSMIGGEYSENFKRIFLNTVSESPLNNLKSYLRKNNCSMVFEVIDPINDPHIIEYFSEKVVLLDIINNTKEFKTLPFKEVESAARVFGLQVKEWWGRIEDEDGLKRFYDAVCNQHIGNDIEEYVLCDNNGYMVKVKTPFYKKWKFMRTIAEEVRQKGCSKREKELEEIGMTGFYEFLKDYFKKSPELSPSIIELRIKWHFNKIQNTNIF